MKCLKLLIFLTLAHFRHFLRQRSSTVELWFCKPGVVGSNPTVGFLSPLNKKTYKNIENPLAFMTVRETLGYALAFLRAILCSRAVLAARLLAAESQLAGCKQRILEKKDPRPRFTASFRLLRGIISKSLDKWEDLAHLMQTPTVKKWHTTAFRYF